MFRRIFHDPERILSPHVNEGDTVLDVGPGMGYFSIPLARLVGGKGSVIAVDIQEEMLKRLHFRAKKAGLDQSIIMHLATKDSIGTGQQVDFALAFWMVHEVPDRKRFLDEIRAMLKPNGLFLIAEPVLHVTRKMFGETTQIAMESGLCIKESPHIFLSRTLLLQPQVKRKPPF